MRKRTSEIYNSFINIYSSEPLLIRSPGRVNLMGDHTDYNEGFVLPAAINRSIILAIAPNNLDKIRAWAMDMPDPKFEADISGRIEPDKQGWANYLLGVVYQLKKLNHQVNGFDCVFGSTIPIGAGLSSSAALEGAFLAGLNVMSGFGLSNVQMAQLGQLVEHSFIGVNCGIMDQFANLHGKKNHLIKLDCRTLEHELIPFDNHNFRLLLCDSKVHRELAGSEYNLRRKQCEQGIEYFSSFYREIKNLRDVTEEMLSDHRDKLDPVVHSRCQFVLDENKRVLDSCSDLENNEFESFGQRMFESHYGLRDMYEVSCPELDFLVQEAKQLDSVYGARMMGGGFGGCTINLVEADAVEEIAKCLAERYKKKTNIDPGIYIVKTEDGTGKLLIDQEQIYEDGFWNTV